MKRVAIAIAGLVVAWLIAMVFFGAVRGDAAADRIAHQLGESLHADATVGAHDLALVRGRFSMEQLHLLHDDAVGRLEISVGQVDCDLLPLGLALADGECRELAVHDMTMTVSSGALFALRPPKQAPPRAQRVVIDHARLDFAPSAFLPSLGRISIALDHAEAGPTVFRTPLSFVFALRSLRARLELPAGITLHLGYDGGVLSVAGSLFGSTPVALPGRVPVAAASHSGKEEIAALGELGKRLAEELVEKRASDWIHQKL